MLTGGFAMEEELLAEYRNRQIPVLFSKSDTYTVAAQLHDLTVKIQPQDKEKIEIIVKLIEDNVDIERLLKAI